MRKLGAYHNDRLCAVEVSYLIEDVIIGDTLFADDLGLSLNVTDFIYHTLREDAVYTDARYFFIGFPTGVKSLDQSKVIRGCKLIKIPAHYKINPLSLSVAKLFMRSSYNKLIEIIAPPFQEEPACNEPAGITLDLPSQNYLPSQDYLQSQMICHGDENAHPIIKPAPLVLQEEPLDPSLTGTMAEIEAKQEAVPAPRS